jgi:hypothetical protein
MTDHNETTSHETTVGDDASNACRRAIGCAHDPALAATVKRIVKAEFEELIARQLAAQDRAWAPIFERSEGRKSAPPAKLGPKDLAQENLRCRDWVEEADAYLGAEYAHPLNETRR